MNISSRNTALWIRYNGGFTLLEILVAILIFVLGSTSIWALWLATIENHKRAVVEQGLANFGESLFAEIQFGLLHGQSLKTIHGVASKNFPGYHFDLEVTGQRGHAVFVRIRVYYLRYGKPQEEEFYTVFYQKAIPEQK